MLSPTKRVVLEAQMDSDGPPQHKPVSNRPLEAIGTSVPPRPSRFEVGRSLRSFLSRARGLKTTALIYESWRKKTSPWYDFEVFWMLIFRLYFVSKSQWGGRRNYIAPCKFRSTTSETQSHYDFGACFWTRPWAGSKYHRFGADWSATKSRASYYAKDMHW